jgi:hypothetical protein
MLEDLMEKGSLDHHAPLETALTGVGFRVDRVEKQGKRTVITVSRCGQSGKTPVFPNPKAGSSGSTPEKQGTNDLGGFHR